MLRKWAQMVQKIDKESNERSIRTRRNLWVAKCDGRALGDLHSQESAHVTDGSEFSHKVPSFSVHVRACTIIDTDIVNYLTEIVNSVGRSPVAAKSGVGAVHCNDARKAVCFYERSRVMCHTISLLLVGSRAPDWHSPAYTIKGVSTIMLRRLLLLATDLHRIWTP